MEACQPLLMPCLWAGLQVHATCMQRVHATLGGQSCVEPLQNVQAAVPILYARGAMRGRQHDAAQVENIGHGWDRKTKDKATLAGRQRGWWMWCCRTATTR